MKSIKKIFAFVLIGVLLLMCMSVGVLAEGKDEYLLTPETTGNYFIRK